MNYKIIILIFLTSICSAQRTTIYTIGDSTMSDKPNVEENPERGWAQMLSQFFNDEVLIENKAVNGRSTKSFINEQRWDSIQNVLKKGDYVFIQFGHNDQKLRDSSRFTNPSTSYRNNLIKFIEETREKDATPILFTSIVRRKFNQYGVLIDTHGLYPLVTRMVADEFQVPLIDLQYYTEILELSYGIDGSKDLHLHFEQGEHNYYPNGKNDDTHLSEKGALEIAKIVVEQLKCLELPLSEKILLY